MNGPVRRDYDVLATQFVCRTTERHGSVVVAAGRASQSRRSAAATSVWQRSNLIELTSNVPTYSYHRINISTTYYALARWMIKSKQIIEGSLENTIKYIFIFA